MTSSDKHLYEFAPFLLDAGSRILLKDGATVRLTPKAFETLLVLVRHAVQVVDKEKLLKEVWTDSFVEEGSLSRNIHELRKALGDDSSEPHYIETIPKRGYRFVAPVKVSGADGEQIDLASMQSEAAIIEKHTFARVISEEFEEPGPTTQAATLVPAVRIEALALAGITQQRKKVVAWASAVIAVLVLAGALGAYFYQNRARVTPAPATRAKSTLVRLTNNNARDTAPTWSPD